MKKIICEICGSSDMMKQEGVFVCQSCGCKYSAEEIRKMLSEVPDPESAPGASGAPEPATAVQPVPAVSQKFENLRQLARRAKAANDSKDAAKYYGEMLLENPNDWEAAFYSVFYEAHNCTIAQIGVSAMRVRNNLSNVMNLIKNYVM